MTLDAQLEAILFAAAKPLRVKFLADLTQCDAESVRAALDALDRRLDETGSGIMLQRGDQEMELVTRPEAADSVSRVVRAETQGELTRAALEALSILAYCGPLTRPELEQIRGVQSSMILRNLMLRGLVEQKEEERLGQPVYSVTFEFLNHLGMPGVEALPDYADVRGHAAVSDVLNQRDVQGVGAREKVMDIKNAMAS